MLPDDGSQGPETPPGSQILMARAPADAQRLAQRSRSEEARFRSAYPAALKPWVLAPARLHARLFAGLCPELPQAVGSYRGTPGTPLEGAKRAVRLAGPCKDTRALDPCMEPAEVRQAMAAFCADLAAFWTAPRHPVAQLAALTQRFFHIHPFLDGNGHVWRLSVIALARHAGCRVATEWQVAARPYGPEFSHAIQVFAQDATVLEAALGRFIRPD